MTHRLAVMGGDGVGPELVAEATRVLFAVAEIDGFEVVLVELPHSGDHYRRTGVLIDAAAYETLRSCESLLFGAAGDPDLPPGLVERALILDLSRELDLCIGVRAAYLHHEKFTPLKEAGRGDVDLVIVRDTTEGELPLPGGRMHAGTPYEAAATIMLHTTHGVERTVRYAFELAMRRRRKVSLVAQSNVLVPHQLWEEVFARVASEFEDVEAEALLPDHAVMRVVLEPRSFDVVVTNLLFGGILTDLVAALVGGMGLVGSSRLNPQTRFGMYEPAHGSAPKYTGQGKVSPMATLRALSMLLDNIGEHRSAARIEAAIDEVLSSGVVPGVSTRSGMSTTDATTRVIEALECPAVLTRVGT
ncbi:MAG TPA: isocitrate/isopropylmalate family dehydrogenase [Acidimicrobiales bacterium]|nr:isocitrate/isopropylmalate family dehydrogenase [Acidimicrobiales bacterium]